MTEITLEDIQKASVLVHKDLDVTPLLRASRLNHIFGLDLYLKLENTHHTGSFKERGALNKLHSLSDAQKKKGVIAMSAGNHAQGLAYHAHRLGIPATIVMPVTAPFTKIERTESFGAEVLLSGETLAESEVLVNQLIEEKGLTLVHPYNDPKIIAGQGTIGLELLTQMPDLDTIIVPIGGGGMISGIAIAAKSLKPSIKIIGVQTQFYPSMQQSLTGKDIVCSGRTIADGIAVKNPGSITRELIKEHVDEIILVDEESIEAAIDFLAMEQKLVVEGAGAVGLAAVISDLQKFTGQKTAIILSGGNIDARLLASVMMRGLVHQGRIVRLRIQINDSPGVLSHVAGLIGEQGANIVEVSHQRLFHDVPVRMADLDVVIETQNDHHVDRIINHLNKSGFPAQRMQDIG